MNSGKRQWSLAPLHFNGDLKVSLCKLTYKQVSISQLDTKKRPIRLTVGFV